MREGVTWKTYALTVLCIVAVVTSAVSAGVMAKYTAAATATASARVAKWDVVFGNVPAGVTGPRPNGTVAYIRPAGTNAKTTAPSPSTSYRYFYVYNNSEVAATVTIRLLYTSTLTVPAANGNVWPNANGTPTFVGTPHSTTGVTGSGTTATFIPPGGRAAFRLNINGTPEGDVTPSKDWNTGSISPTGKNNDTFTLRAYVNAAQID